MPCRRGVSWLPDMGDVCTGVSCFLMYLARQYACEMAELPWSSRFARETIFLIGAILWPLCFRWVLPDVWDRRRLVVRDR